MTNKVDIPEMIFQNAIDSIELGIEDYKLGSSDSKRYQSSVRNVFAGILLLLKSRLAEISKDNDFSLLFASSNKKRTERPQTVGYETLLTHLKGQGIEIDWKCLRDLHDYRNDIEHYFSAKDSIVGSYIANSFLLIKKFIEEEWEYDPQECFSEKNWQELLKEESVHCEELARKTDDFNKVTWFSPDVERIFLRYRCSACDSDLIRIENKIMPACDATMVSFVCRNCGQQWTYSELTKEIADELSTLNAMELKDGGQEIIGFCPECGEETYCSDGDVCLQCGAKGPFYCSRCEIEIPMCELLTYAETEMCGWCAHMEERMLEDDDE